MPTRNRTPDLRRRHESAAREKHVAHVERFLASRTASMAQLIDEFSARVGTANDVRNLIAWMLRHDRLDYVPGPLRSPGVYRLPEREAQAS